MSKWEKQQPTRQTPKFAKRYVRNMNLLSKEENDKLSTHKVCIIGCGGLGGYVIEGLARMGLGHLTVIDGDTFDETNLNRQLLSTETNLGYSKAKAAFDRVNAINSGIRCHCIDEMIDVENGRMMLKDHDVIVDAVDSVKDKLDIQALGEHLNIPIVHGAIGGWYGQVTTIFPGDRTLDRLYGQVTGLTVDGNVESGMEKELGNPSFTPAAIASVQIAEVLKVLLGRGDLLRHKFLYMDLYSHAHEVIDLE